MKIDDFCSRLKSDLAAKGSLAERLEYAAGTISRVFRVKEDEVALFAVQGEELHFLWPRRLQNAGTIPLSSSSSLAARTAVEGKAFINNAFAATPHLFIFEAVPVAERQERQIQKIVSVPIHGEAGVVGVLQLSRKGSGPEIAGPDFTQPEQAALAKIADTLSDTVVA
ncbi:MAG TPA: hypothetical protein VNX25_02285 [Verrucomicrobiae bacterium]|nr:hypothetical protein [Verrucomicrobiae bacterium]